MKEFKLLFFIMLGISSFIISCDQEDEAIKEEIIEEKWTESTRYSGASKILLNSGISDDKLVIVGLYTFSVLENNDEYSNQGYSSWGEQSLDYKPMIHKKKQIIAHTIDSYESSHDLILETSLSDQRGSWPNVFFFNFDQYTHYDSEFPEYTEESYVSHVKYYKYEFGAFNNQDQLLIVIEERNKSKYTADFSFALIDLNIDYNTETLFEAEKHLIMDPQIKKIDIPNNYGSGKPYLIYSFNGYFFIGFGEYLGNLWRVSPNGEIIELLTHEESPSLMFDFKNILYSLGNNKIYKSLDNGLTWEYAGPSPPYFDRAKFFQVNGILYCYLWSQIFIVDIGKDVLEWKELDNSGLEGYAITSVTEFRDRVYVTTLNGLFYKSIEGFLKPKEAEENE